MTTLCETKNHNKKGGSAIYYTENSSFKLASLLVYNSASFDTGIRAGGVGDIQDEEMPLTPDFSGVLSTDKALLAGSTEEEDRVRLFTEVRNSSTYVKASQRKCNSISKH